MANKGRDHRGKGPAQGLEEQAALSLGELLGPHAQAFERAATQREEARARGEEEARARASVRWLDEGELMRLIFSNLDAENPRVCDGLDFDRLVILVDPPARPSEASALPDSSGSAAADAAGDPAAGGPPSTPPRAPGAPGHVLRGHEWVGGSWVDDVRPVSPDVFDRPELDGAQQALLRRAGGPHLSTCNLRHMRREPALRHLGLFVTMCRSRGERFARVIPGKGVLSAGEPVLKKAVLGWCQALEQRAVLAWAPEVDRHGEWGAMVVELRAPGRG